ncbi:MAG: 1-deoxy-D-xylulose-5-phosphate reductoisomerase, partial [Cyanobacteria bacterium MAG CAR4_bin_6]|nr:1-deoxy-D-xylulose-5-phosphate reductoisomerase [Cyanobacteria bacterium MAG CAR4_bin_6]
HFLDIPRLIERTCDQHRQDWRGAPDLDLVLQVDGWARQRVGELQGQGVVTG